ncbi:SDR family NAD(P)-dependent oxidoreductase [Jannaschia sp. Os4]|uniref:SDR family NAD(P)-dependent oxidoreductase n=1 Tax=Jannaschia sp. Os4 TaxID=2807617 RepID=UPI0019393DE3|nr:SDR family NAD(P)-dependent oxidoreductase [Jannaschia sp. Os4]MBM2574787.1 SDR family NAD(P)-dependent oxidoreductase [Jannaschia sp. Os4]
MSSKGPDWRGIAITGASGGIGAALAEAVAAPGRTLLLMGRDADRLAAAAARVRARGGAVETAALPLSDRAALAETLQEFDRRHPVDLLVANAGVKTGNARGVEPAAQTARVLDVNLGAAFATVGAVLPAMQARGRGRIALTGSMAAVAPVGDLLSYAASKAGLHAYAKGLRRAVAGTGVGVTLLVPGFVDTPMTDRHAGPTPLLLAPEAAARRFADGLARGARVVAAPRRLWWLARLGEALPGPWADRAVAGHAARIAPDADEVRDEPPARP